MANLYEILGISQKATEEEIDNAYKLQGKKYQSDINNNSNAQEAEKNMQLLISAYKILRNPTKRKEYDQFLEDQEREKQENEEMSKNINSSLTDILSEEVSEEPQELSDDQKKAIEQAKLLKAALAKQKEIQDSKSAEQPQTQEQPVEENRPYLSPEEARKKLQEIEQYQLAQKEQLEKAKLAQLEYEKAKLETEKEKERLKSEMMKKYNDTYNAYMKQLGYKEKKPWTWKRIKTILIVIVAIILVCFIAWQIPDVRNPIIELYNTNGFFKFFADLFINTFKLIINTITGIFK